MGNNAAQMPNPKEPVKKVRFVDNDDGTITDRKHQRMWMKNDTWVELGRLITWHEGQEYAREMNEKKFAEFGDWHLPTGLEAKQLFDESFSNVDIQGAEIHIDPVFASGCGFTTWTNETRGAKAAMGYDFRSNYEYWLAKENDGFPSAVRLVRTAKKSKLDSEVIRFVNNTDGTVSDHDTGLMWKADDSYLDLDKWVSWGEAKNYIQDLNKTRFAGYQDWRMPTRKEAQTIHDPAHPVTDKFGDTVFIANSFPPGCGITCWTKTLHKTDRSLVIRFQFYNGDFKWHQMGLRSHGVRPVRKFKD